MKLIAHRGGRGFGIENTLEAMMNAARSGIRAIETDVRVTRDGELIICHDHMIWGHFISRTSYDELKEVDQYRPLLSEVLDNLAGWVEFNLEVKDAPVEAFGEMIETYNIAGTTLVTSFHRPFLSEFKKKYPHVQTGYLFRTSYWSERKMENTVEMGAEVLLPHFHSIDDDLIRRAHDLDLKVYTWTVNSDEDLEKLIRWDIDGVITDRYLDFSEFVERRGHLERTVSRP